MDYFENDGSWSDDWTGLQSNDVFTDADGSQYIWTGTNWGQIDTGGMGAEIGRAHV